MMKQISYPIFRFFLFFFAGLIVVSFALFFLFLNQNNLTWSEYWQTSDQFGSISLPKLKITKGIKTLHKEINLPALDKLFVSVDIETISFVESDREDILVVYDYRHPNSPEYSIDFKAFSTDEENRIIASTQSTSNSLSPSLIGNLNDIYRGSVAIHVPKGFRFDTLSITTTFANINPENSYPYANNFFVTSSMGNVTLQIDSPKDLVLVDCDLGNAYITASAPINTFDVLCNLGSCQLNFKDSLRTLYLVNDFGSNSVYLTKELENSIIQSNSGSISLYAETLPKFLNASSINGNILAYLGENNDTDASSVQGIVVSHYPLSDRTEASIQIRTHNGNIELKKPSAESREHFMEKFQEE